MSYRTPAYCQLNKSWLLPSYRLKIDDTLIGDTSANPP